MSERHVKFSLAPFVTSLFSVLGLRPFRCLKPSNGVTFCNTDVGCACRVVLIRMFHCITSPSGP